MNTGTISSMLALLLVAVFSTQTVGQTTFEAHLSGSNEVHLASTTATGTVEAVLDGNTLELSGSFSGLTTPVDVSIDGGAHIHIGYAGENGPIEFALDVNLDGDGLGGSFEATDNTFELDADEIEALEERRYYVNIHTERYPAGEIRGQLVPASDAYFRAYTTGNNEVPPLQTEAYGAMVVELDDDVLTLSGAFTGLSSAYTASHIHVGYAGQSGPVEIPLVPTLDDDERGGFYAAADNSFELTLDQLAMLYDRNLYVNIHSEDHGAGEIRGQIVPQADAYFNVNLFGATETPPVDTEASGALVGELIGNELVLSGSFAGLTSPLAVDIQGGAHIHLGFAGESGGIVFDLEIILDDEGTSGVLPCANNLIELGEDELADLLARRYYVNIHSENHTPGEIRGQILGEARSYFTANMDGLNEVIDGGPVMTEATGGLVIERTGDRIIASGSFEGLGSDLAVDVGGGAHLHIGGAGETGDVLVPLVVTVGDDDRSGIFEVSENTFTMDEETEGALLEGNVYVNVHSVDYQPGEIRGQMLHDFHFFPTASEIESPADGGTVSVDPELTVSWSGAEDPAGHPVVYIWQVATEAEFETFLMNTNVGGDTSVTISADDVMEMFTEAGVGEDETLTIHHRIISSNGSLNQVGAAATANLTFDVVTSIDDDSAIPERLALHQNYPNPFNPTTQIRFDLPQSDHVTLSVYNALGQQVETLINQDMQAGFHTVNLDGTDLSSGVYVYRLDTGSQTIVRKMLLVK